MSSGSLIAEQFVKLRIEEVRGKGRFGSLHTLKSAFRSSLAQLVNLMDQPHIPILLYGEKGTGKRFLVEEFALMSKFYHRLNAQNSAELHTPQILQANFLNPGFSRDLIDKKVDRIIYIEHIDKLSPLCQEELLIFLKSQAPAQHLFFGTERALSLLVLEKAFSAELFKALSGFTLFVPNIKERNEDMPLIVTAMANQILPLNQGSQTPPYWLIDSLGSLSFNNNLDDLHRLLSFGFSRNPVLSSWTPETINLNSTFHTSAIQDATQDFDLRKRLRLALEESRGDRIFAAKQVGMSRIDFTREILRLGIR